ncbi:MAG: hypothetical protein K2G25_02525, partial [Oscillospiraceae bacterium]|nr:hypothetical protein [Oscillospiraceae bacterium]
MAENKNGKTNKNSEKKSDKHTDQKKTAKSGKKPAKKTEEKPEKTEKPKKPEISMPAVPEPEPDPEESQEEPEKKGITAQALSVCLFALGVLTILLIFVQGNALWKALHEMLKGFFGIPVIAIPAALFFSACQVEKQEEIDKLAKEVRWFAVCMMFTSCFIEIMFDGEKMLHYNFGQCLKLFYQDGIAWHGGGMLSAPAFLIVRIFDVTGSKIMICLLLFVSIMLLTKRSLTDLFDLIGKPFRDFVNIVQEDREEGRILKNYENQQIEQERLDEQEALAIAAEGAARKRSMQEEFLTIDIPMTGLANGNSPAQKHSQNPQGMGEFFAIPIEGNPHKNPEYTQD